MRINKLNKMQYVLSVNNNNNNSVIIINLNSINNSVLN